MPIMKQTIISWLVNASVAAFAVGALQIPLKGIGNNEASALVFSIISFILAVLLSRERK